MIYLYNYYNTRIAYRDIKLLVYKVDIIENKEIK